MDEPQFDNIQESEADLDVFEFQLDSVPHYEPIEEMPEIEFDNDSPKREINAKYERTYSIGFAMLLLGLSLVAFVPVVYFWINVL